MEVCGYEFEAADRLDLDRTDGGVVAVDVPQREYGARGERSVHPDGWGPFCRFELPSDRASRPGVYLVTVDDEAVYVGEASDVEERFTDGYGDVAPADCFEGGDRRACRVNTEVFHAVRAGRDVRVHLHSTADFEGTDEENAALRRIISDDLLSAFDAAWNREDGDEAFADAVAEADRETAVDGGAADAERGAPATPDGTERRASPPSGTYRPLYDYLTGHEFDRVQLSFEELEVVLGAAVPNAARNWRQWWTNSEESHPHARSWLRAGYEIASLSLDDELVVFERLPRGAR